MAVQPVLVMYLPTSRHFTVIVAIEIKLQDILLLPVMHVVAVVNVSAVMAADKWKEINASTLESPG